MKKYFTILILSIAGMFSAQSTIIDFESIVLPEESFLNGSNDSGGFNVDNVFLPNVYNPSYGGFWSGWAISNTTDTFSPGYLNQYSAIPGTGFGNSQNYALSYAPLESKLILKNELQGQIVEGLYVTNGTYPFLSMLNGDGIAKRFGGPDGNDPDFFKLTVKKYLDGELSIDSVDFYLADYRFDDNSMDYIIDEWTFVDLSSLGHADSLVFSLSSSDIGQYGMNTPGYFYIDNIMVSEDVLSTDESLDFDTGQVFPNPSSGLFNLKIKNPGTYQIKIFDFDGRMLEWRKIEAANTAIDLSHYPAGTYLLHMWNNTSSEIKKLIIIQ